MNGLDIVHNMKDRRIFLCFVVLILAVIGIWIYSHKKEAEYRLAMENQYNMTFLELVEYVKNIENYLAKSLISNTPEHGTEMLTNVWREATLASAYLGQLPVSVEELSKTQKFLNQVGDYSFALSRKSIYGEKLSDEDLKNLDELHTYSLDLEDTLNQLVAEMQAGELSWVELTSNGTVEFAQQVSNITKSSLSDIDGNFQEYAGLIYDGAYSENIITQEKRGLTGDNISEQEARNKVNEYFSQYTIENVNFNGLIENGNIASYDFSVKIKDYPDDAYISISQKGGHLVCLNINRDISVENISSDEANNNGREYLKAHGFASMKETYYLKANGIVTINYAYTQNGVTIYPDLIKVKVALDDGEILGVETEGYLHAHYERDIPKAKITMEQAKATLNKDIKILSEGMAIIPTKSREEIYCYEFKGETKGRDFLIYINAENGREQDILMIINTLNGTLTM